MLAVFLLAAGFPRSHAEPRVRRNVEVEFESVDNATLYEVKVTRKAESSDKAQFFKMKEPKWTATINPGLYLMQVRSYDDRGAPGDWSPPTEIEVKLPAIIVDSPGAGTRVNASGNDSQEVEFIWEAVPRADHYTLTARTRSGEWNKILDVTEPRAKVDVPVGQEILWNVVAIDNKGVVGESSEAPYQFELHGPALAKPSIERPLSKYIRELRWRAPDHSSRFSYDLQVLNRKTRKWEAVESKTEISEPRLEWDISRPSGRYRLAVQAHGDRRKDSPKVRLDFEAFGGFRDPAALDRAILRDSLEKPTHFYVIASYLITQVKYAGANYDDNSVGAFNALGGTGRVGLGYQRPLSAWGGFGIADLSGFVIKGQTFQFASVEGHVTRRLEFGQSGVVMAAAGLYAKELPVLSGSAVFGYNSTGKVKNIGPHGGFTYWYPWTDRLGIQANARIYYSIAGNAPSGGKTGAEMSYQYGLMGSYRLGRNWLGYAGYAFRRDKTSYATNAGSRDSFAIPGQVNSILIEGHYLNLILEYSF